ncbi:MAG TPA: cbb3-type cytochrome c oxidase subunit I [Chitinophagaceae bacterium]|nr:cbb3-type cytochrome c oxidase subunit I [Chitinophagaceae bacterium]
MDHKKVGILFIVLGLSSLLIGLFIGSVGGLQYILPSFLKEQLAFQKVRPLHVYLVINFIFSTAAGCIYYFLPTVAGRKLYSVKLGIIHFSLQLSILLIILSFFFAGKFSGREYLEFPPWISLIILFSWIIFMINFFKTITFSFNHAPVYIWSWSTGLIFYFITMTEAHLWLLPYFNKNIVRDLTVQWKALGSMVGAWNMLVYGTSMFVMESISGDKKINKSKTAFFFYFLGLTNLMFNWGHHTYIVPSSPIVKEVSFIISMTELLVLGKIIYNFRKSYIEAKLKYHHLPFRLLSFSDAWIFLNLVLAITISVPAINLYTHGTHITVAHAMGATIGINTMLLLGSVFFVIDEMNELLMERLKKYFGFAIVLLNISLFIFWGSLISSGIAKSIDTQQHNFFAVMIDHLQPYFKIFAASGILVMIGLFMILIPVFKFFCTSIINNKK